MSAISVGVVCIALIETINEPVALTTIDCVGGCRAVSCKAGGMTSTAAVELELFRLAVTIVVPKANPVTENVAWVWFAGTSTVAGKVRMPVGLAVSVTVVFDGCAEEIVTVSVLLAPTTT